MPSPPTTQRGHCRAGQRLVNKAPQVEVIARLEDDDVPSGGAELCRGVVPGMAGPAKGGGRVDGHDDHSRLTGGVDGCRWGHIVNYASREPHTPMPTFT
ncbi:hypothetical protein M1D51_07485 [Arthrobacter sp. R3-55]